VTLRARWVTLRARWVTLRARWVTQRARWVTLRARWVDAESSLGDAESSLGDAKRSMGDAKSSLGRLQMNTEQDFRLLQLERSRGLRVPGVDVDGFRWSSTLGGIPPDDVSQAVRLAKRTFSGDITGDPNSLRCLKWVGQKPQVQVCDTRVEVLRGEIVS
jgi:hypothetical protein